MTESAATATATADHGAPSRPTETQSPPASSTWQLGKPLGDRFDLSTLRAQRRIAAYRYDLAKRIFTVGRIARTSRRLELTCTVEFGAETGMAELHALETPVMDALEQTAADCDPRSLLTTAGKLALKEALVRQVNQHLKTARARTVYFTHFLLAE